MDDMTARICAEVAPYTMVPPEGIALTVRLTLEAIEHDIPGDLVECGTWRGGCSFAMLLAQRYHFGRIIRPVWMYDSFQGMGEPSAQDGDHGRGWAKHCRDYPDDPGHFNACTASVHEVANAAVRFTLSDHVKIVRGWFRDTVQAHINPIAVLRIDCDWYEPCKLVWNHMEPLVSEHGAIIIDDYFTWGGCILATHEYLAKHERRYPIRSSPNGYCAWLTKYAFSR